MPDNEILPHNDARKNSQVPAPLIYTPRLIDADKAERATLRGMTGDGKLQMAI